MRLSEAILLGAMMRPQAFRALFTDDGACALGGALLAVGATGEPALRSVRNQWPWAFAVSANCPDCARSCPVFGVITHLNDNHRWTREQIATWVAGIEPAGGLSRAERDAGRPAYEVGHEVMARRSELTRPDQRCGEHP
jgi:hypothetical protein